MSKRLTLRVSLLVVKLLSRILANICEKDYRDLATEISSVVGSITEELQEP